MYRHLIVAGLVLGLASCGFQLRGNIDIPPEWQELRMVSPSPNGELAREVRDGFSNNGVQWVDAATANYVLRLDDERFEQRNLTIGSNARATEFELTLSTTLQDVSVYILAFGVLKFLQEHRDIARWVIGEGEAAIIRL